MQKRIINILFFLMIFHGFIGAQMPLASIHPLKVGDRVPDVYLSNVMHYKKKHARLISDFGGKPLILDFWNTHCQSCIRFMPLMDSIAKENRDKLSFLLCDKWTVTDSVKSVDYFFTHNPYVRNVTLPTTVQDTVMGAYFPGEPYQVWIDKNGIVLSISLHGQVTRENVRLFLEGKLPKLRQYIPYTTENSLDGTPMLMIDHNLNGGLGKKYYSYISGYDSATKTDHYSGPHPYNGGLRITILNRDILSLYKQAYIDNFIDLRFKPYQFILEVKDSAPFQLYPPAGGTCVNNLAFRNNNLDKFYSYELYIRGGNSNSTIYKFMQQDLDRYFGYQSHLEKRLLPCLVLQKIRLSDILSTTGRYTDRIETADSIRFVNVTWHRVKFDLNDAPPSPGTVNAPAFIPWCVIDETGYPDLHMVDMAIPPFSDWKDLEKVNAFLKKYNLVVTKEDRLQDVIVIRSSTERL